MVTWDYGALARYYDLRADYEHGAIAEALDFAHLPPGAVAVDIGAGTGKLTRHLLALGYRTFAIEPCAEMRAIGASVASARWLASDGCSTGLPDASAQLVSYGSSFNVLPSAAAVAEAVRLLGAGHVLIVYNHRDLSDPLQMRIEALVRQHAPSFDAGARRASPLAPWGPVMRAHRYAVRRLVTTQSTADFVAGFRAHATLIRQLPRFEDFLADLRTLLDRETDGMVTVPFHTRTWCLQVAR